MRETVAYDYPVNFNRQIKADKRIIFNMLAP